MSVGDQKCHKYSPTWRVKKKKVTLFSTVLAFCREVNVCPTNLSAISRPEVHSDIINQSVELLSSNRISVVAKFRETFSAFTSVKMWHYLSNCEPPRKKAKSGENQSAERFKQYDKQTRQRKFQSAWKTTRVGNGSGWCLTMKWSLDSVLQCVQNFCKDWSRQKGAFCCRH